MQRLQKDGSLWVRFKQSQWGYVLQISRPWSLILNQWENIPSSRAGENGLSSVEELWADFFIFYALPFFFCNFLHCLPLWTFPSPGFACGELWLLCCFPQLSEWGTSYSPLFSYQWTHCSIICTVSVSGPSNVLLNPALTGGNHSLKDLLYFSGGRDIAHLQRHCQL